MHVHVQQAGKHERLRIGSCRGCSALAQPLHAQPAADSAKRTHKITPKHAV